MSFGDNYDKNGSLKAFAKINLNLDIKSRREDGYHTIASVMQRVSLSDTVTVSLNRSGIISIESDAGYIPSDAKNTAFKAARSFLRRIEDGDTGVHISIEKSIPVGAGMGGGSADAAAVLILLNGFMSQPLSAGEIMDLGAGVGADVPFCIMGGTALAEGIGDKLTPLPPMPECTILICKPSYSCSTQELYQRCDRIGIKDHPDMDGFLRALRSGDLLQMCRRMFNVFEELLPERRENISAIRDVMLEHGAMASLMTGSGSAMFGVFSDPSAASGAASRLSGFGMDCRIAHPF